MDSKSISIHNGKSENDNAVIHSIPCNVDYNGHAAVDSYFNNCTKKTEDEGIMKASFRGRCLMGKEIQIPEGFKGVVVNEKNSVYSDEQDRKMEVIGNFNQLTYWNLENKPSSNDGFHKAFDWLDMAHVLHSPITDSDDDDVTKDEDEKPKVKKEEEKMEGVDENTPPER